jgi:hypothetical protein
MYGKYIFAPISTILIQHWSRPHCFFFHAVEMLSYAWRLGRLRAPLTYLETMVLEIQRIGCEARRCVAQLAALLLQNVS